MATKDTLRARAARMREEMQETGRLVLRAPALVRGAECAMRFLLGAVLSGAEIFGGYAPFRPGTDGGLGIGAGRLCRPGGDLLRLPHLPGLCRRAAVCRRRYPDFFGGLRLL